MTLSGLERRARGDSVQRPPPAPRHRPTARPPACGAVTEFGASSEACSKQLSGARPISADQRRISFQHQPERLGIGARIARGQLREHAASRKTRADRTPGRCPHSMSALLTGVRGNGATQRIADHDGLPAEMRNRQVERLDQVEAGQIGRETESRAAPRSAGTAPTPGPPRPSRPRGSDRRSGTAAIRRTTWPDRSVFVGIHCGRRLLERARVGADELAAERARGEIHLHGADAVLRVGGSPREVADHGADVARRLRAWSRARRARRAPPSVRFCAARPSQSSPRRLTSASR